MVTQSNLQGGDPERVPPVLLDQSEVVALFLKRYSRTTEAYAVRNWRSDEKRHHTGTTEGNGTHFGA